MVVFLLHWIAWLFFYALTYLPTILTSPRFNWTVFSFQYLFLGSINFILFYLVAFFLLPKIGIKKRRWIILTVLCLVLAVLFTYLKFRLETERREQAMRNSKMFSTNPARKNAPDQSLGLFSYRFKSYLQNNLHLTLSIIFIAFAYRLLIAWYLEEKNRTALENQKLKAELAFLELQVNPHFLFNALNNIYSLSVMENSSQTGNGILKLSELLRYMLYEKTDAENKIPLDNAIRHINNYIDFEKIRHQGPIYVNFSIEGDTRGVSIAPLLLFPLVENACKHGVLTDPGKPVTMQLIVTGDQLHFSLENYINLYQPARQTGGIGVQNVKKRLDLLYGDQYRFAITKTDEQYKLDLKLPL